MSVGKRTLKMLLCSVNFICVILAITLILFGNWLLDSIDDIKVDHGENLGAILTIMLGTVILIVAIFGSIALFKESKMMLIAYGVILVMLLIIQLILVSISYTAASGNLSAGLQQGFDELWDRADNANSTLSYYEQWLHCCGKHSAEDYFLLDKIPPSSCCKNRDCTNVLNLYVVGCEQSFKDYMKAKTSKFNTISWLLILVEIVGSILACNLVDRLRNRRDRVRLYN